MRRRWFFWLLIVAFLWVVISRFEEVVIPVVGRQHQ